MKMFPIQEAAPVRWELAERAYHEYVKHGGRGQSLERLSQRGGFGLQEFACFFNGHEARAGHRECIEKADAVGILIMDLEKARDEWKQRAEGAEASVVEFMESHVTQGVMLTELREALGELWKDASVRSRNSSLPPRAGPMERAKEAFALTPTKAEKIAVAIGKIEDKARQLRNSGAHDQCGDEDAVVCSGVLKELYGTIVALDAIKKGE